MGARKKSGRPKLPENIKKIRFSVTLRPILVKAIDKITKPEKGRNAIIEETLEKAFL